MGISLYVVSDVSTEPIRIWNPELPEGYSLIPDSNENVFSVRNHPELDDISWSYSGLSFWKEAIADLPGSGIAYGEISGVYGIIRSEALPPVLDFLRSLPLDGLKADEESQEYLVADRSQQMLRFFEQTVGIPGAAVAIR